MKLSHDPYVSKEVATTMHRITTLVCFMRAHLETQKDMMKYFSGNGKIDDRATEDELARVILQSQCAVYEAIEMAVTEERRMESRQLLKEVLWARQRKNITEDLEEFVWDAYKDGGISSREAESILHPLHTHIARCLKKINSLTDGELKEVEHIKSMCTSRAARACALTTSSRAFLPALRARARTRRTQAGRATAGQRHTPL